MKEITNFYLSLETNWAMLTVMIIMGAFIGIFHNVIFSALFKLNLRPFYLFCVLNPALIVLGGIYSLNLGALIAIFLFVSVFVFAIIGMIYAGISDFFRNHKENSSYRKKKGLSPIPIWKKIISKTLYLIVFCFIGALGVPYAILALIVYVAFLMVFKKNNRSKFYALQRDLPKAPIRSVAMGLAEISGDTLFIESLKSKIDAKDCIGYHYTIEDISKDSEGKESFTTVFSETVCNPFYVKDRSGQIKINTEEIELIDFPIDQRYRAGMKRYTQYVLYEKQPVLLIGKASISKNNEVVFEKERIKNVFGIAPLDSVENYNLLRPVINTASYYFVFWLILVVLIILTPIKIKGNKAFMGELKWSSPFINQKPIRSITDFYDAFYQTYSLEDDVLFETDTLIEKKDNNARIIEPK